MVAPVAKAAVRKVATDPGAVVLFGVVALVVVSTMVKQAAALPGEALGAAWSSFRQFGEADVGRATDWLLIQPSELADRALETAWSQGRSVWGGIMQGALEDDPGPEYYARVHYGPGGVPVAVPVEINRTAKGIGRGIRRAIGDWSIPGF